jgi:hypothetical protein
MRFITIKFRSFRNSYKISTLSDLFEWYLKENLKKLSFNTYDENVG